MSFAGNGSKGFPSIEKPQHPLYASPGTTISFGFPSKPKATHTSNPQPFNPLRENSRRNWLSVFFTVEQSAAHGAQLQLELAEGFLFQTQCLTQRLPSYHYVPRKNVKKNTGKRKQETEKRRKTTTAEGQQVTITRDLLGPVKTEHLKRKLRIQSSAYLATVVPRAASITMRTKRAGQEPEVAHLTGLLGFLRVAWVSRIRGISQKL